jgi:hypothetical protein
MSTTDSKIFLGCILGKANELLPKLLKLYPMDNFEIYKYVEYLNTVLPDGLYINITYPEYGASLGKCVFHLDLLSSEDHFTLPELQRVLSSLNLEAYRYVLGQLEVGYVSPKLYSHVYIF